MTALYQAHSGVRYLVLLLALVALAISLYGFAARRPSGKGERVTMAVFTGVLDLQILLGIGLIISGIFYGALMGHLMMMILAAVSAHAAAAIAKKTPDARRAHAVRAAGVALALVLMVGGVIAIGRSPLGSSVPTMTE
jgi:heme A synthase